jgi:hypothetical protein
MLLKKNKQNAVVILEGKRRRCFKITIQKSNNEEDVCDILCKKRYKFKKRINYNECIFFFYK